MKEGRKIQMAELSQLDAMDTAHTWHIILTEFDIL